MLRSSKQGSVALRALHRSVAARSQFPRVAGTQLAHNIFESSRTFSVSTRRLAAATGSDSGKNKNSSGFGKNFNLNLGGSESALETYGQDLTKLAMEGKLDPVIGRDEEIRRTIQILSRR